MKKILISITGAAALILAGAAMADPQHGQHTAHGEKAAEGPTLVLQAYAKAIADEDVAAMGMMVASEGTAFTIFEGSGANIGWADYRDHHLAPEFANPDLKFHTYQYQDITTQSEGGLAFSTFSIKMGYTYKGEDKSRTGRGTAILKRQDGAWKIIHLHTS
jgi:ketosteroid isomerase-like protein